MTYQDIRVGLGYDVHKIEHNTPNNKFYLGGILISDDIKVLSKTDGDVLLHALTDALLGALSLGNMSNIKDSISDNSKSINFLHHTLDLMHNNFWSIKNIDILIVVEKPILKTFLYDIKNSLLKILNISEHNINIKAKSNEGLDSLGNGEAVSCQVVCLLVKK